MLFKKHGIFIALFVKRELPLFSYLLVIFTFSLLYNFLLKTDVNLINPKGDISYLLKVIEVPNRSNPGELRFKAKVLGEVKRYENEIVVTKVRESIKLFCKAVELPWKNISNIFKDAMLIARGEVVEIKKDSNFSKYLATNNYNGFYKIKFVSILNEKRVPSYKDLLYSIIDKLFTKSEVKALLKGMLFGDKSELSFNLENTFRNLGLSHLLVVSGFHVGLFFFISSYLYEKIFSVVSIIKKYLSLNILIDLFSLLTTFGYCLLVGLKASCVRALLAIICYIFFKNLGYKVSFLHLLSIYILCFLIFNQNLIYTLSLQYSFLALLGIMYANFFKVKSNILNYILVSTLACTFTSILTLSVFDSYNFLSIVTNAIFSPLLILLVCKVGFFILFISIFYMKVASFLAWTLEELLLVLFQMLDSFSSIDILEISSSGISKNIYFFLLFLVFAYINYRLIKYYRLKYNI